MLASPSPIPTSTLQLVLFIDDRPSARDLVGEMEELIQRDRNCATELQVINVSQYPYLAEHFRVVMTPALVKVSPLPRQTIAGKNLLVQLESSWSLWQNQIAAETRKNVRTLTGDIAYSTELIQLADEVFRLKQEKADLEERLRFKDRVLAMLAHDLRNPLTAVSLALETIEYGGDRLTPEQKVQMLKHARTQTKILDGMIADILDAGRDAEGEMTVQLQRIDLGALCQSVVHDFFLSSRLEEKQQLLKTDIPTDLPLVYADEERIRQVLMNLLGNAIKYTPVGGNISVSVLHRTAQKVEVSVCDDGPGIPHEHRDLIFQHRYRIQRDDNEDGYGIGLALCQRIVRVHYGRIWVDASGKTGSCFHFTLPVY